MVHPNRPKPATLTDVMHGLGRVLVVDDDEVIRRLIAVNLQLEGFEVETAVDGQDCLDKVTGIEPDVITLDVMMPRLDGWETAVQLRRSPDTAHIKVVLISARAQEADKARGAQVGADAYLTKPFDPNEMIRVVRELAGRTPRVIAAELRRAISAAAGQPDSDPLLRPGPRPGSYTSTLPLRLPREAAAALPARLAREPWIATADLTSPGYLTVTVTHDALAGLAVRIARAGPACARKRRAGQLHPPRPPRHRPDRRPRLAVRPGRPRRAPDRPPVRRRRRHRNFFRRTVRG